MIRKCIRPGRPCEHCVYLMQCRDIKASAGRDKYAGRRKSAKLRVIPNVSKENTDA